MATKKTAAVVAPVATNSASMLALEADINAAGTAVAGAKAIVRKLKSAKLKSDVRKDLSKQLRAAIKEAQVKLQDAKKNASGIGNVELGP